MNEDRELLTAFRHSLDGVTLNAPVEAAVRRGHKLRTRRRVAAISAAAVIGSVRAELAPDYFQMRRLDAQKELLDNTVASYEQFLQLTQVRFKGGVATEVDVAEAQTQLEQTRAQDVDVGVGRAQYAGHARRGRRDLLRHDACLVLSCTNRAGD